jgi:hypothetical protein
MADAYTPSDGLKNVTSFPTDPADETAARKQVQDVLDQILAFHNTHMAENISQIKSATHVTQSAPSQLAITFNNLVSLKGVIIMANVDAGAGQMCWGQIGPGGAGQAVTDIGVRTAGAYAQVTPPVYLAEAGVADYYATASIAGNVLTLSFTNTSSYPNGRTIYIKAIGFNH